MKIMPLTHRAASRLLRKFGYEYPETQLEDANKLLTRRERLRNEMSGTPGQDLTETATGLRTYSDDEVKFVTVSRRVDPGSLRSKENTQVIFPLAENHKSKI